MPDRSTSPISITLRYDAADPLPTFETSLRSWLLQCFDRPLATTEDASVAIRWHSHGRSSTGMHLALTDLRERSEWSIGLVAFGASYFAFITEIPYGRSATGSSVVELSVRAHQLLKLLSTDANLHLNRFPTVGAHPIGQHLNNDEWLGFKEPIAPGIVLLVTRDDGVLSMRQQEICEAFPGLVVTVHGSPREVAPFLEWAGVTEPVSPGGVVSIARGADGITSQVIGSMSLKRDTMGPRRLILRHQLAPPVPANIERSHAAFLAHLRDTTDDTSVALELLEESSAQQISLVQELDDLRLDLEIAWLEQTEVLDELDSAKSQIRYMEAQLRNLGEFVTTEASDDDEMAPTSCLDALIAAREALEFLEIPQYLDPVAQSLDDYPKRSVWGKKIWSALRALNDYAKEKANGRFNGGLSNYRSDPPPGAIPLTFEYAPKESESTSKRSDLREMRCFAVPSSVDASGKRFMEQHIKIDKGGPNAPRIHFYDDTGGSSRRVHIGYVGPHLATSSAF